MNNTHIIVTGGFDPIHSGHIAYFESAKELGHKLWVGINSNDWLSRKKGQFFLDLTERLSIISNFSMVDHAFAFDDDDNSACGAIEHVLSQVGRKDKIIFAFCPSLEGVWPYFSGSDRSASERSGPHRGSRKTPKTPASSGR